MAAPDELIVFGAPFVTFTPDSGNMAQVTIGAPAPRWQSLQWQIATQFGFPDNSY